MYFIEYEMYSFSYAAIYETELPFIASVEQVEAEA